jgi:hypothetical protein
MRSSRLSLFLSFRPMGPAAACGQRGARLNGRGGGGGCECILAVACCVATKRTDRACNSQGKEQRIRTQPAFAPFMLEAVPAKKPSGSAHESMVAVGDTRVDWVGVGVGGVEDLRRMPPALPSLEKKLEIAGWKGMGGKGAPGGGAQCSTGWPCC